MKRRFLILAGCLFAALSVWSMRETGAGLHISGDGAPAIARLSTAPTPSDAKVEVILLRRWQNLEGLSDLRALCRAACGGRHWALMVHQPSLRGLRRVLFVNVGELGTGPSLDEDGTLTEEALTCLSNGLPAVLVQPRDRFLCDRPLHHVWRLPAGL